MQWCLFENRAGSTKVQAILYTLTHRIGSYIRLPKHSSSSPKELEPRLKSAERPRAARKPFVAAIVIFDVASEKQISTQTSNLSLHGCFAPTPTPLNSGAKVHVTIVHASAKFLAAGRVVFSRADGMGISFTKVEQHDLEILERWLSDLRK